MSEKNGNPKDWKKVKLGEVCKLKNGYAFKSSEYGADGIPIIRISDINDGVVSTEEAVKIKANSEFEDFAVENGDILVAMSGATTGKFGIFKSAEKAYQNQRVGNFKILDDEVLKKDFLFYQLHSLKRRIEKDAYGGAQPNISSKKIEEMEIAIAPLPTQHRIVSKIEELFSELDKGIENLKTAQQQLKTYRQAVLKWAFEGKLSESGFAGLKDEQDKAVRKKSGKSSNPVNPDSDILPKGWKWVKLGEVVTSVEYGSAAKSKEIGKIPVLRMGNIQNGKFDWDDLVYTDDKEEIKKYSLKKNDVLFNRTNSPELVGKTAIYKGEQPAIFAGYLIRINRIESLIDADYLTYFLNTHGARSYGNTVRSFGVNQSNINGTKLKTYPIPLAPIEEQHRIVQEIESRLSVCDKTEETITASLQQAEALRQSILKRAFEGRLV